MFARLLILVLALAVPPIAVVAEPPTNVVLIVSDDLGHADLGCTGSVYYQTPNLDRLAAEGVRFTQAYAACAVCSPTRASILTGRYPARVGVTDWIRPLAGTTWTEAGVRAAPAYGGGPKRRLLTPRNPRWMERDEITIAEQLSDNGYTCGFIGKWHLGPEGWMPEDQGFTFNAGGCDFGHPPHYFDPYPAAHQKTTFPNLPPRQEGEYLTDREADEAVGFIRANADRPFFLCLAHYAVHSPIQAKADLIARYEARLQAGTPPEGDGQDFPPYAAMVHSVDDAAGAIMRTLDELGLADNTLVIFTSDNGGAVHFRATDNRPLRSGKGRPYEGGIRVPLLMRWPAGLPEATVTKTPANTIDLLPTILAATNTPLPLNTRIDGIDLAPTARGTNGDRALFWHYPHYWWGGRLTPYSIIRDGRWKLIRWYETGVDELYDLDRDPAEATDVAASNAVVVRELGARLEGWLEGVGATIPKANPAYTGG